PAARLARSGGAGGVHPAKTPGFVAGGWGARAAVGTGHRHTAAAAGSRGRTTGPINLDFWSAAIPAALQKSKRLPYGFLSGGFLSAGLVVSGFLSSFLSPGLVSSFLSAGFLSSAGFLVSSAGFLSGGLVPSAGLVSAGFVVAGLPASGTSPPGLVG